MQKITLGSLFDGIGGFPFAASLVGIRPVWAAEIDPSCVAVTRYHFPDMEHLGSVTEINGSEIPPVDIITFGSPCQDLSVAGNRAGLDGEKSGLFREAVRIIYEMRSATNGKYPAFIVWENVPGAFSSHKGRDFRTVLEEITQTDIPMPASGKWASAGVVRSERICAAWRQLDAQYWGVPQRRKRIYLIGSFGSNRAEEILFERDSVQRYLTPRGTQRKGTEADPEGGAGTADTYIYNAQGNGDGRTAPTMTGDNNGRLNDYCAVVAQTKGFPLAVRERCGCKGGGKGVLVQNDKCNTIATQNNQFIVYSSGFLDRASVGSGSIGYEEEKAPTLRAGIVPSVFCIQGKSIGRAEKNEQNGSGINENVSFTLNTVDRHAAVYGVDCRNAEINEELNGTLQEKPGDGFSLNTNYEFIEWIVRRFTPLECERLQGYPDGWTELPKIKDMSDEEYAFYLKVFSLDKRIRGKARKKLPTKFSLVKWYNRLDCDGNRYRQLGNSLAIPCALRVIGGIAAEMEKEENND